MELGEGKEIKTMVKMYFDEDADLSILKDKTIAIVGYRSTRADRCYL